MTFPQCGHTRRTRLSMFLGLLSGVHVHWESENGSRRGGRVGGADGSGYEVAIDARAPRPPRSRRICVPQPTPRRRSGSKVKTMVRMTPTTKETFGSAAAPRMTPLVWVAWA